MKDRTCASIFLTTVLCLGCAPSSPAPSGSGVPKQPAARDASSGTDNASASAAVTGSGSKDAADEGQPATGDSEPAKSSSPTIATPERLTEALKAKNPGFSGEVQMEPISADLLAVAINDSAIKDISPLARQRIGRLDLSKCDIADLSPLEGLPLDQLFLEDNQRLSDISALRGMPLQKLYLSHTRVENLSPLRRAPLEELNLLGTRVKDLSPLAECPIKMLWLTGCPVADISPLRRVPLISLTLQDTLVTDLSPLEGHPLQRLHIGGSAVTDLTPVGSLQLTRLVFTPSRIKKGLDLVRKMPSLKELGTRFDDNADDKMPPATFWELYDKGELK